MTSSTGDACTGKVISVQEAELLISVSERSSLYQIKSGDKITSSKFLTSFSEPDAPAHPPLQANPETDQTKPISSDSSNDRNTYGVIMFGLSLANEAIFNSVSVRSGNNHGTGTYSFETSSAIQGSIGLLFAPKYRWGIYSLLTFEGKREIRSESAVVNGVPITAVYIGEKPTVQFTILEVGTHYRWSNFYLPFGLNCSFPRVELPSGATERVSVYSGVGAQVGVGVLLSEQIRVERISQAVTMYMTSSNATTTIDAGTGILAGVTFRFGYNF